MRSSSNPAFRNLPTSPGGYARFGDAPAGLGGFGETAPGRGPATGAADRPLTVDDVVQKTAISVGVTIVVGLLMAVVGVSALGLGVSLGVIIVGAIAGLVLAFVVIAKQSTSPALVLTYAAIQGVVLGGLTGLLETSNWQYRGIGFQAILGVVGVFIGMLVVYKTGAIKVTSRLVKMVTGALIGVLVLMLANGLVGLFVGGGLGLRDGGPWAYLFSLVCIGVGAFMLLIDFDRADQAVKAGVPARFAWYLAFGFTVTLVWLYLEILRLLSYLRGD